ncbi:MAG: MarR family transcriptional regulator [Rhodospirillales bacterium]|nr:MarR family transcriptional regulator [Rhodospirillales bacterium]
MPLTFDPERSVGFLVHDLSRLLRRNFNRRVQALGLTETQWRAIAQLSRNEGINQATLADLMEVQPITIARLIDRIETAGWVERRPDPTDRRAVQLYLTDKAQPILALMQERASETRERAMAGLLPNVRETLIDTLRHMKRNLVEAEAKAARGGGPGETKSTHAGGND